MIFVVSAILLLLTVLACLAVGLGCGYFLILGILNAFNPHRQPKGAAPSLVTSSGN